MNMKRLLDILDDIKTNLFDFIEDNIKYIIICIIILINIIGFLITNKNTYYSYLFFPDNKKMKLIAEKREIIKGKNKKENIENIIDELLIGPFNQNINNILPGNSKLLNVILNDSSLFLNFSKETIMGVDLKNNNDTSIIELLLQSVIISIYYKYHDIKNVYFYFDGKEYKYIGKFGPIEKGISPNWKFISK